MIQYDDVVNLARLQGRIEVEKAIDTKSYNQYEFQREYNSIAKRIGSDNIRIFSEVYATPTTTCNIPE